MVDLRSHHRPIDFAEEPKKNDNAHVEQKNWTHVRQLFGYHRFDNECLVAMMNDLYRNEWSLYQNHFIPTMKCIEKVKINSRYQRKFDTPKTPYQRVLDCPDISNEKKEMLKKAHQILNPFELKRIIDKKLKRTFSYVQLNKTPRKIGVWTKPHENPLMRFCLKNEDLKISAYHL